MINVFKIKRGALLILSISIINFLPMYTKAQVSWPDISIFAMTVNSGTLLYANNTGITAPFPGSGITNYGGTAQVDFKAGTFVHLGDGFNAGNFAGSGYFHASIQNDFDVVITSPVNTAANMINTGKLEKLELGIKLPANITTQIDNYLNGSNTGINPYDPDKISIEATFKQTQTGTTKLVYGFYYKDYTEDLINDNWIQQNNDYPWRVRFAPPETGSWSCSINVIIPGSTALNVSNLSFNSYDMGNQGYLEGGLHHHQLRFHENKQSFFAIGQDIAWPLTPWKPSKEFYPDQHDYFVDYCTPNPGPDPNKPGSPPGGYKPHREHLHDLTTKGGNYTRIILSPWNSSVEWEKLGDYDLRQPHLWEMDQILDQAHTDNLYILLCLDNFEPYKRSNPWGNPDTWDHYPYHTQLGLTDPIDFFSSTAAQLQYKKRLRYIVARWGYSTNIAAYELFNEIDQMDGYSLQSGNSRTTVVDWHNTMSSYIKQNLDNKHLITTSYSGDPDLYTSAGFIGYPTNPSFYNNSGADITSRHVYNPPGFGTNYDSRHNACDIGSAGGLAVYNKPYILGELGLGDDYISLEDCSDVEFHNTLWATSFMGSYGSGLYWNEESNDDYRDNFIALSSFMSGIDFEGNKFEPQEWKSGNAGIESFTLTNLNKTRGLGWMQNRTHAVAAMPSCGGTMAYQSVPNSAKLEITGLKVWSGGRRAKYDIHWYRTPHSGVVSIYHSDTYMTKLSGKLKVGIYDMFRYADDYAYKIYLNGSKELSETQLDIDTLDCPNDTLSFNGLFGDDTLGTQYSYHWNFGNGTSSELAHPKAFFSNPGSYFVTLIINDNEGINDTLSEQIVVLKCDSAYTQRVMIVTAINSENSNTLKVYPNPNNGIFHIKSDNHDIVFYCLYNAMGGIILEKKSLTTKNSDQTISLEYFPKGIYFLKIIMDNNQILMKKIIFN